MLLKEASVSNVHAIIFELNHQHYIRDLGSRTGTFVNGEQIHNQALAFNDVIRVGDSEMRFVPTGVPSNLDELEHLIGTSKLGAETIALASIDAARYTGATPASELPAAQPYPAVTASPAVRAPQQFTAAPQMPAPQRFTSAPAGELPQYFTAATVAPQAPQRFTAAPATQAPQRFTAPPRHKLRGNIRRRSPAGPATIPGPAAAPQRVSPARRQPLIRTRSISTPILTSPVPMRREPFHWRSLQKPHERRRFSSQVVDSADEIDLEDKPIPLAPDVPDAAAAAAEDAELDSAFAAHESTPAATDSTAAELNDLELEFAPHIEVPAADHRSNDETPHVTTVAEADHELGFAADDHISHGASHESVTEVDADEA